MFIKKMLIIVSIAFLIIISIIFISISGKNRYTASGGGKNILSITIFPIQKAIINTTNFFRDVWNDYFALVSTKKENKAIKKELKDVLAQKEKLYEIKLANERLIELLNLKKSLEYKTIAAEVIGKDSAPWFRTIIIDKGSVDGIKKNMPVVVPEGVAGRVIDVFSKYSKAILIIDSGSAIDALVQRTRARGIIKGNYKDNQCYLEYVLRKHDVKVDDIIISSGMGGVFPKGLRIGKVVEVVKSPSEIFQKITIEPYVDFERLEEVLLIVN